MDHLWLICGSCSAQVLLQNHIPRPQRGLGGRQAQSEAVERGYYPFSEAVEADN